MSTSLIFLAILAGAGLYSIATYNQLVGLREKVKEAWSGIEVQMKQRYNLIPNLVETVKGFAKHESGTFEKVTKARSDAMANQGTPAEQAASENILSGTLKSLFALSENYPELKANQSFLSLQSELSSLEDKIQSARRYYNGVVRTNNVKVDQFPSNLVAKGFAFIKAEFFELSEDDDAARKPVAVNFD